MYKSIIIFLLIFLLPSAGHAQCYSPIEAEADQGIRIHSELMVIGLNCQAMGARHGMNLYGDYREFTAKHADLLAKYESILMNFFKKNGMEPKQSLNTLRTDYANKISDLAAQTRPDIFCAKTAERITKTKAMSNEDIRKWAASIYKTHPVSYNLCEKHK